VIRGLRLTRLSMLISAMTLLAGFLSYGDSQGELKEWKSGLWQVLQVRYVRIEGEIQNLETAKLVKAISPSMDSDFFSLDLSAVALTARSVPWVASVEAERLWPDTVVLHIHEHRPIARWGDTELLNDRGERFSVADTSKYADLPLIRAPTGTELQMKETVTLLNVELANLQLKISEIALNKRQAWIAKLSNRCDIVFGRQDPLQAVKRFMTFVPKLGERKFEDIERLDLRYPNGFSVIWRARGVFDSNTLSTNPAAI